LIFWSLVLRRRSNIGANLVGKATGLKNKNQCNHCHFFKNTSFYPLEEVGVLLACHSALRITIKIQRAFY